MKTYKDFGVTTKNPSVDKVKWTEFIILVPSNADKKEIQAAMEYFHDNKEIDTDFVTVNQLVHEYPHLDESDKYSLVLVDPDAYQLLKQKVCPHPTTFVQGGIRICKECGCHIEVTSYRD